MSLSIEWIPKTAYMHSSLDQSNYSLIKQEAELFENTLNTHSVRLQVSSKETDKEAKQQIALAEQPVIVSIYNNNFVVYPPPQTLIDKSVSKKSGL